MRELINFSFKGSVKQYIAVLEFGGTWTDDKNKFETTFEKASLELAINFLLDNYCFNFGSFHFYKSLESPWVLTQHLLWLIYFYITMKINDHQTLKREIYKKHTLLAICFVL